MADQFSHSIRSVEMATGVVATVAGNGEAGMEDAGPKKAKEAQFRCPCAVLAWGDSIYVCDRDNHAVRSVNLDTGQVQTLAGTGRPGYKDGPANQSQFNSPGGLAARGSILYVSDSDNNVIRAIDLHDHVVSTLAGNGEKGYRDGPCKAARFHFPTDLLILPKSFPGGQNMIVADKFNHRLRYVDLEDEEVKTVAGCGTQLFADGEVQTSRPTVQGTRNLVTLTLNLNLFVPTQHGGHRFP